MPLAISALFFFFANEIARNEMMFASCDFKNKENSENTSGDMNHNFIITTP